MKRQTIILLMTVMVTLGCAAQSHSEAPLSRERQAPQYTIEAWRYAERPGHSVATEHYIIRSTVDDPQFLQQLALVMEGALQQYQKLTPGLQLSARPMECFIFARRREWVEFTREETGPSAAVYLQINRGGYTVRDRFVARWAGDVGTFAVAAHEGWHQYTGRHLRSRLPPCLEEGIATMFENITWDAGLPRWNLATNPARVQRLRDAIEGDYLWPLEKLLAMHAGEVVGLPGHRIEAFYAQNWALARFLLEAEQGRYRPVLHAILTAAANGTLYEPLAGYAAETGWNPQSVKPLLEHYLAMDLGSIARAYDAYIRQLTNAH
jgi:hypothetical protein